MARSLRVFQKKLILLGGTAQVSRLLSMYKNVLKKQPSKMFSETQMSDAVYILNHCLN